jgi:biopolymer transport protein ExbD
MIRRKRASITASIPTASMADIAFLLIIFFLVTTSLSQDKGLGLTLPPSGSTTLVPSGNITAVQIDGKGEIAQDGRTVTARELAERIAAMTARNPDLIVTVKTAPEARYEVFVRVIDTVKKAGNDKISIVETSL